MSAAMVAFPGHTEFVKKANTYFDKDYRIVYSFVLPSLYNWHPCRFLVDIYHSLDCYLHMAKILKKYEMKKTCDFQQFGILTSVDLAVGAVKLV